MAEANPAVAEQFEEMPQQQEAATLGMWTFLATEILFFGALFLSYIVYRHAYPAEFREAGHHTLLTFGTINTAILLTSSLTMALAVRAAQLNSIRWLVRLLLLTAFLGACFLAVKGLEYNQDISEHLLPGRQFRSDLPPAAKIFWFLYWVMTAVHAIHLMAGIGVVLVIALLAWRGKFSDRYYNPVEMSGLYWHFVDVIWIFLYPTLYLISR